MSLKVFETSQAILVDPEESCLNQILVELNQKKWRNTWSFQFNRKMSLFQFLCFNEEDTKLRFGKHVRKYYGKKVLLVTNSTEAKSLISRSKLIESIAISENCVKQRSLKSKGNLVIMSTDLQFSDSLKYSRLQAQFDFEEKNIQYLHFKKIIKHCQKADIEVRRIVHPGFLKYMAGVKHLSFKSSTEYDIESLGKVIINLGQLESLKFEYLDERNFHRFYDLKSREDKQKKFFSKFHKQNHLKKISFTSSSQIIEHYFQGMKQDLEMFYSKPLRFKLRMKILFKKKVEGEMNSIVKCILDKAECLIVKGRYSSYMDELTLSKVKKQTQRIKAYKQNIVKIVLNTSEINLGTILHSCSSLKALYLKPDNYDLNWKICSDLDQRIKGFAHLQNVILFFSHLKLQDQLQSESDFDDDSQQPAICSQGLEDPTMQSKISTFSLIILDELKQKCHSLQDLSLFLKFESIMNQESKVLEILCDEISRFDKLKALNLCIHPANLSYLLPSKILTNKDLETLSLEFNFERSLYSNLDSSNGPKKRLEWDQYFALEAGSSLKRLSVNIGQGISIPLCGPGLLGYIQKVEHLQVIELTDQNYQMMTFDLFYGLLMELLQKKTMKKILICTKVVNSLFSPAQDLDLNRGMFFSKNANNHLEKMLKGVYENLEAQAKMLKEFELEEILVGRLKGYSFDYMLYSKKMQVVDKIFWSEKEMNKLLTEKKELEDMYYKAFRSMPKWS